MFGNANCIGVVDRYGPQDVEKIIIPISSTSMDFIILATYCNTISYLIKVSNTTFLLVKCYTIVDSILCKRELSRARRNEVL